MHRITLLSIGKVKTPWIVSGCAVYGERLAKQCSFSERVLSAGVPEDEQGRVLKALADVDGAVVVLDERGKELSSREWASWIAQRKDAGTPITFVLGGAYGLSDAVRKRANLVLSLSRMTLPHELCKLVFFEQLYRAHAILSGSGYHH